MANPPKLVITPPLLNSANPWATSLADLSTLYNCPYTGAVTTRTSLLQGFPHDDRVHQYTFFDPLTHETHPAHAVSDSARASLNTLGYSPVPLDGYLKFIEQLLARGMEEGVWGEDAGEWQGESSVVDTNGRTLKKGKAFIISVTGSASDVGAAYARICELSARIAAPLAMEINLSCPNIPDAPPPAYSADALTAYICAAAEAVPMGQDMTVPIGIKTPPFTYHNQFVTLIQALKQGRTQRFQRPISFVTATNTLGGCLVASSDESAGPSYPGSLKPALASATGMGIGGLAGAPLHPLALGNVVTIRKMLDAHGFSNVDIIGVGGVEDAEGFERMRAAGAVAVGVGTGLGRRGVGVFGEILREVGK